MINSVFQTVLAVELNLYNRFEYEVVYQKTFSFGHNVNGKKRGKEGKKKKKKQLIAITENSVLFIQW